METTTKSILNNIEYTIKDLLFIQQMFEKYPFINILASANEQAYYEDMDLCLDSLELIINDVGFPELLFEDELDYDVHTWQDIDAALDKFSQGINDGLYEGQYEHSDWEKLYSMIEFLKEKGIDIEDLFSILVTLRDLSYQATDDCGQVKFEKHDLIGLRDKISGLL